MEETRKRVVVLDETETETETETEEDVLKKARGLQGEEDMMEWLGLDDDAVRELMKLFDSTSSMDQEGGSDKNGGFRVKFIDYPYSTPVIFQSSSSYITINGNEESCGSSFSDLESSVMASVDMKGMVKKVDGGKEGRGGTWGWIEEDCSRSDSEALGFEDEWDSF